MTTQAATTSAVPAACSRNRMLCSQERAFPWSRVLERRSLCGNKVTEGFAINTEFSYLTASPASVSPSAKRTRAAGVSHPSLSVSLMDSGWAARQGRPGHLVGQPDSAAPPPVSRRTVAIPRHSSILRQTSLNLEGALLHARPDGFVERSRRSGQAARPLPGTQLPFTRAPDTLRSPEMTDVKYAESPE